MKFRLRVVKLYTCPVIDIDGVSGKDTALKIKRKLIRNAQKQECGVVAR